MVGRILLWAILGLLAWWILRPNRKVAAPPQASAASAGPVAAPEAMVDCAACGLHFPASEAVRGGAQLYCCAAHRDAGPRRGE